MKKLLLSLLLLLAGCGAQAFEFDSWAPRWSLTKAMPYDKMAQHTTELSHYFATGADLFNADNCKKIVHYYAKTKSDWKQKASNSDDVTEKSMHKQHMRRAKKALGLALDLYRYRAHLEDASKRKDNANQFQEEIAPEGPCQLTPVKTNKIVVKSIEKPTSVEKQANTNVFRFDPNAPCQLTSVLVRSVK